MEQLSFEKGCWQEALQALTAAIQAPMENKYMSREVVTEALFGGVYTESLCYKAG